MGLPPVLRAYKRLTARQLIIIGAVIVALVAATGGLMAHTFSYRQAAVVKAKPVILPRPAADRSTTTSVSASATAQASTPTPTAAPVQTAAPRTTTNASSVSKAAAPQRTGTPMLATVTSMTPAPAPSAPTPTPTPSTPGMGGDTPFDPATDVLLVPIGGDSASVVSSSADGTTQYWSSGSEACSYSDGAAPSEKPLAPEYLVLEYPEPANGALYQGTSISYHVHATSTAKVGDTGEFQIAIGDWQRGQQPTYISFRYEVVAH